MLADEAAPMDDKRTEARRESARRENHPEVEKFLGSILPEAQPRGDDRREKERRDDAAGSESD